MHERATYFGWGLSLAIAGTVLLFTGTAQGHKTRDSYLSLTAKRGIVEGRWDVALQDLDKVVPMDDNKDGTVTWEELRGHEPAITKFILAQLTLRAGTVTARIVPKETKYEAHEDGIYSVQIFTAEGLGDPSQIEAHYQLFATHDLLHRGLCRLSVEHESGKPPLVLTAIFGPAYPWHSFELRERTWFAAFFVFGREGVHHMWTGWDHLLFLLALLFPAVLRRDKETWKPVDSFRPALIEVVKIVTAFTLAHSVTLSLSVLGWVRVPTRLTEGIIALSVAVCALNNIWPLLGERTWMAAFAFGLVHGFGFASALGGIKLNGTELIPSLVGFNCGVEAGQLAVIAGIFPLAYWLRRTQFYQVGVLRVGSLCVMILALYWMIERFWLTADGTPLLKA
ncbi:MAG: HupE/UreJ family protein [Pedosphaera sp.]|nr:HupE/UreJ family protein [Pedosphaera sp.]